MIEYRVLVIDDDETRNKTYISISENVKKKTKEEVKWNLNIINDPMLALHEVASPAMPQYQIVILDAILSTDDVVHKIIRELKSKNVPYVLISGAWDDTMADTARDAATTYQPISWYRFPKTNDDIQAIASLVTTICHNLANFQVDYAPEPKIDILHLSDLHFSTVSPEDFDKISMRHNSIIDYLERKGARISFIVVTGDITDNGLPHEFDAADKWLSTFKETLKAHFGIMPQVLVVPGNHDHCIALENAYRLRFDRKDKVVNSTFAPTKSVVTH